MKIKVKVKKSEIKKPPAQRVAIFIDTANLYHSAKNLYGAKVNFNEVLKSAISKRSFIRALAYVITSKGGEEKHFVEALKKMGIEVREKELQEYPGGFKKGDWDVGITVDAIRIAPSVDVIVLVSGDGDFFQLVEYLKNQGKRVEIIAFGRSTSTKLKEIADEFVDLEKNPEKYLLK
jgi:uncharacterized protein (TIGR00288 family)